MQSVSGPWQSHTSPFGPAIGFQRLASDPDVSGPITVTWTGGLSFLFSSVRLYSSVTPIPYVIRGVRLGATLYTVTATVPNTLGNDATVANPYSQQIVDAVYIPVTNPAIGFGGNPVALDDLVLWPR